MDKIIKNYEEPEFKPMSTRQYINFLKHRRSIKKQNKINQKAHAGHNHGQNHSHNHEGHSHDGHNHEGHNHENIPPQNIKVVSLAVVVDGIVADVMNVQEQFGEILQKNPQFILVPDGKHRPHSGWAYKDGEFIPYDEIIKSISPTMRG